MPDALTTATTPTSARVTPPPFVRKPHYLLPMLLVSGVLIELAAFRRGTARARSLAARSQRFERRMRSKRGPSILILGDSTGVGVGASLPEESIAGLLAIDFPRSDIANISVSGARVGDALAQAARCNSLGMRFDVAVLHIGANDIVRGTPTEELADSCEKLMLELERLARRTVWLGPPDLSIAPLFRPPYAWVIGARSRAATAVYARSAARHHVSFVDFSAPPHSIHFRRRRDQHFASDGFHPNSSTYRYAYRSAREALGLPP